MMSCGIVPIESWSDAADAAAVFSFPAAVGALCIAAWQITAQLKGSRREAAFEVFLDFTERFRAVSELRRELNSRFDAGDKTVNAEAIYKFYSQYWILQINQWEMFRAGLLPLDIYSTWLCHLHDNMKGAFALHFFDKSGTEKSISSKEAFEETAIRRMLRAQTEARTFFKGVDSIHHDWAPGCGFSIYDDTNREKRCAAIRAYAAEQRKVYKNQKTWNLD